MKNVFRPSASGKVKYVCLYNVHTYNKSTLLIYPHNYTHNRFKDIKSDTHVQNWA